MSRHAPYRPFVIVSYPRSGTHLLRTALESHPRVRCQAEPFNSDDRRLPYALSTPVHEILGGWVFRQDLPPGLEAVGLVVQAYHPFDLAAFPGIRANPAWSGVWDALRALPGLAVIHLRRLDLLGRHLSHLTSRATGKWHHWSAGRVAQVSHLAPVPPGEIGPRAAPPPRVHVDAGRLLLDLEEQERWHARAEHVLAGLPVLALDYAELALHPEPAFERVQRFLGVAPHALVPAVAKLESRTPREAIANYDELAARFRGTRWARLFADDQASNT